MEEKIIAYHFLVQGRVQGVGFRYFVREAALSLGIEGWVRNLSNGNVECIACGNFLSLKKFADALSRGPALARVKHVSQKELLPHEFSHLQGAGFRIT